MIRVIIGTVAVLAGFAVVEHSVEATWGLAGSCSSPQSHAAAYRGEPASFRGEPMAANGSPEDLRAVGEKRPAPSVPPCPESVEAAKSRSSGR